MKTLRTLTTLFVALAIVCSTLPVEAQSSSRKPAERKSQESSSSRKAHEQILKAYGVYENQALQDYVSEIGQRVARQSSLADQEWKFVVLDDDSINAFTTGCCYVYVHRGLLINLNSEAELASVLGHEVAHVTAKHPQKRMTRGVLASIAAAAAAIYTGSSAVADLANLGATAWMRGYGRENELEADRIGLQYSVRAGYRPEAMGRYSRCFGAASVSKLTGHAPRAGSLASITACFRHTLRPMRAPYKPLRPPPISKRGRRADGSTTASGT